MGEYACEECGAPMSFDHAKATEYCSECAWLFEDDDAVTA